MGIRTAMLAAVLIAGGQSVASAATTRSAPRMATLTFRLKVQSTTPAQMTFWVAYGPPAPRFGVIRLHRIASGEYVGTKALPFGARASFAYLAAWGTIKTRAGLMPGDPVVVVKRTRQMPIGSAAVPMALWSGPAG